MFKLEKVKTKITNGFMKVGGKIVNAKNKVVASVLSAQLALGATQTNVFAAVDSGNSTADSLVMNIADLVVGIFPLIGVFLILVGGFKIFMAYRNNQPEEQTSAAKDIVIGAVLIVFRAFVWTAIKGWI